MQVNTPIQSPQGPDDTKRRNRQESHVLPVFHRLRFLSRSHRLLWQYLQHDLRAIGNSYDTILATDTRRFPSLVKGQESPIYQPGFPILASFQMEQNQAALFRSIRENTVCLSLRHALPLNISFEPQIKSRRIFFKIAMVDIEQQKAYRFLKNKT